MLQVLHHEHCKIPYLLLLLRPKQYHLAASHFQPIPWHQHITSITKKANSTLGFLHRNLRHCPTSCLRNAYLALVRPVLEYAAIIWDLHMQQEINMLERVQRNAAHFTAKDYRSTTPGFIRPKIHGYTGCKRMGFMKPDSVKLAMGHLLHSEAAP